MNAISAPKSPKANRLEGFALTAIFQGFPTFAGAALLLKFVGSHEIVGTRYGAAIFVVLSRAVLRPAGAVAGAKIPGPIQARLRAAVLRRRPVVRREDRALADAAGDLAATGDERDAAVTAG